MRVRGRPLNLVPRSAGLAWRERIAFERDYEAVFSRAKNIFVAQRRIRFFCRRADIFFRGRKFLFPKRLVYKRLHG